MPHVPQPARATATTRLQALAPILVLLILTSACQAPRAAAPASGGASSASASFEGRTLNIVTGGTGGVYIVYGAGLADILSKKMRVAASAQSTAASIANMQLIRDGKADLAFTLADTAYDAFAGRDPFSPADKVDARTLAVLYSNYTHIVVRDGAGINTVADLRGKRVSMGAAASGTEIIGNRVLEAYGLNPETDIDRERLGVADSASAMKDDKIDAFFWSGGLPTAQITDLVTSTRVKFLDHADAIQKMVDKYGPFYFPIKIPRGTYQNDSDVTVAGVANLLVVPASFDPALVKAILQTTFDSKSDLETVHPEAKNLTLQSAVEGSPLDFHPGAIDFYREKGVWRR
jgi:uncharacterized protein